jgi:signal transduction histidine kinase
MTARRPRGRLLPALFDLMIAGLVVVGGGLTLAVPNGMVEVLLIGGPMTIAVLFRRRYPVIVMAVVSAFAFVQVIADGTLPAGYDVAVLIALYAVVKYARHVFFAYLAGCVAAVGIVLLMVARGTSSSWASEVTMYTAVCAAVWLTAYVLRTRRLYVESLEERAATAERERDHLAKLAAADERASIARELHDVVAHSLAVMIVQADGASYALDGDREQARNAMQTIAGTGRDALEDMRRIVGVLRGTASADDGEERRRIGLDQLGALAERARSAGLGVDLRVHGQPRALAPAEELTIYRLAQEALTNALRHAGQGALVTVALTFTPTAVTLDVVDDGAGRLVTVGGVPEAAGQRSLAAVSGGHGLIGMRERVAVHGGDFSAGPRLGGGWQVRAMVPVKGVA